MVRKTTYKKATTTVSVLFVVFFSWFSACSQSAQVSFQDGSVLVTGLPATLYADALSQEQWAAIFRVYTQEAFNKKLNQPVGGTYTWNENKLSFTPHVRFAAEQQYHALFGLQTFLASTGSPVPEASSTLELLFSIPEEKHPTTTIESVHPQASVLPENMLRMYIEFSAPMMPGEAYDHITLVAENGKVIDKAFLVIDQELWDAERKRFTLLFDPGRVKRGIRSNEDLGSPLHAGQTYRLVIDSTWRDANGKFIANTYQKSFTVGKAQRTKLSTADWKFKVPKAGSHDALQIEFDRPVDYALAMKCMFITSPTLSKVDGNATLMSSMKWSFVPDRPWEVGEYHVEVFPELEDVAGNNFNNVFDIDLSKEARVQSSVTVKHLFLIKPLVK